MSFHVFISRLNFSNEGVVIKDGSFLSYDETTNGTRNFRKSDAGHQHLQLSEDLYRFSLLFCGFSSLTHTLPCRLFAGQRTCHIPDK